jgi:membrane protease subunit (stomatin/prohibitin family)
MAISETERVEDYLRNVIVSRFCDHLGESLNSLFDLPGQYETLADGLSKRLQEDFADFGLGLTHLFITSVSPPPDVQQAIDDRSRVNAVGDLDGLVKMKAAMAMEKAATTGVASDGMGVALGLMLPSLMGAPAAAPATKNGPSCATCRGPLVSGSQFCSACGSPVLEFDRCTECHETLAANARFCSKCGHAVTDKPSARPCKSCRAENLPHSVFCNQCGERM